MIPGIALAVAAGAGAAALGLAVGYVLGKRHADEDPSTDPGPEGLDEAAAGDAFLATLSHEWRTPLTAIIGYSEMLQESGELSRRELLRDLKRIQNAGQHLLGLVDDLGDLWRLEGGRVEVSQQRVDVARLINEVVTQTQALIDTTPHRLEVEIASGLPMPVTDRVKLRRALVNLVRFACGLSASGKLSLAARASELDGKDSVSFVLTNPSVRMEREQIEALVADLERAGRLSPAEIAARGLTPVMTVELCRMIGAVLDIRFEGQAAVFTIRVPVGADAA